MNLVCYYGNTLIPVSMCKACPYIISQEVMSFNQSSASEIKRYKRYLCPIDNQVIYTDLDFSIAQSYYCTGTSTYSGMYKGY